tara:strand:- start:272 stop:613 length:342 start_codon:yes stop_codon:yes gene_type:complete
MRILLILVLIFPIGMVSAQSVPYQTASYSPESEQVCFGGDIYAVSIYTEVKIYFDTPNPNNITECTVIFTDNTYVVPVTVVKVKERKYNYRVVAKLNHPKFDMMNKFVFRFPK